MFFDDFEKLIKRTKTKAGTESTMCDSELMRVIDCDREKMSAERFFIFSDSLIFDLMFNYAWKIKQKESRESDFLS